VSDDVAGNVDDVVGIVEVTVVEDDESVESIDEPDEEPVDAVDAVVEVDAVIADVDAVIADVDAVIADVDAVVLRESQLNWFCDMQSSIIAVELDDAHSLVIFRQTPSILTLNISANDLRGQLQTIEWSVSTGDDSTSITTLLLGLLPLPNCLIRHLFKFIIELYEILMFSISASEEVLEQNTLDDMLVSVFAPKFNLSLIAGLLIL
jgi:hypothetical protein